MKVNFSRQPADLLPRWEFCFARERSMLDLIMLALGLGFFALSVGYAFACDRL